MAATRGRFLGWAAQVHDCCQCHPARAAVDKRNCRRVVPGYRGQGITPPTGWQRNESCAKRIMAPYSENNDASPSAAKGLRPIQGPAPERLEVLALLGRRQGQDGEARRRVPHKLPFGRRCIAVVIEVNGGPRPGVSILVLDQPAQTGLQVRVRCWHSRTEQNVDE